MQRVFLRRGLQIKVRVATADGGLGIRDVDGIVGYCEPGLELGLGGGGEAPFLAAGKTSYLEVWRATGREDALIVVVAFAEALRGQVLGQDGKARSAIDRGIGMDVVT